MSDLIRDLPDNYKSDGTIDIGKGIVNERKKFLKHLNRIQSEMTEKRVPFCYAAAKRDFEKEQLNLFNRKGRSCTVDSSENVDNVLIKDFNLKKYSDLNNFVVRKERPIFEQKLIDGIKVNVKTGKYMEYTWKDGGFNVSIQVDNDFKPKVGRPKSQDVKPEEPKNDDDNPVVLNK